MNIGKLCLYYSQVSKENMKIFLYVKNGEKCFKELYLPPNVLFTFY